MTTAEYRIGFCPQCQTQIMVRDTNGRWSTFKTNYASAYLCFGDSETKEVINICKSCLKNPDLEIIYNSLIHENSQAYKDRDKLEVRLVSRGTPIKIEARG